MLVQERNQLSEDIEKIVEQYGSERSSLLQILQAIQKKYHFVSDFAQQEVARHLNIHPVEVYSTVSFYAFLRQHPRGRNVIRLCKTICCDLKGKTDIEEAMQGELGIKFGETTNDRKVYLEYTNCIGMCDVGPAMLVNEKVYTRLDVESVVSILKDLK
jgi:NADH:ubiquinone oxidoreductase subunit E